MRKEKIINFIETKKRKIIGKESTSHNMGFARCGVESRARKIFAGWRFFPRPKFIVSCPAPREALSRYLQFPYSKTELFLAANEEFFTILNNQMVKN